MSERFSAGRLGRRLAVAAVALLVAVGLVVLSPPSLAQAASSAPVVTKISATSGRIAGGAKVTVQGRNFTRSSVVLFGGVPATRVVYTSSKKLVAVAPPHRAGRVDVTVVTRHGTSKKVKKGRYTFVAPPVVTKLSSTHGKTGGGEKITLYGKNFTKVSKVTFGGVKARKLKVHSSTRLTVVAPRHSTALVQVKVVGSYGTCAAAGAAWYQFGVPEARKLRVASFNIRIANGSETPRTALEKPWEQRRVVIAGQIRREGIAVVGLQEASAGLVPRGAVPQYQDLANTLGPRYALTSAERYCTKPDGNNCTNGGSNSDRIIYDTSRLVLQRAGARSLDGRGEGNGSARMVAWAQFLDRNTGKRFFFATTHLEPGADKKALHASQAKEVLTEIREENTGKLPVVLVGDLASTKFSADNTAHTIFTKAGYVDPLGNTRKQKTAAKATAEKLTNVRYSSLNDFKPKPQTLKGYKIGSYIDYILLSSKKIRVLEWETVLNLRNGRFSGVIPSDHNMVKATITLP